jgi:hypothetical protein
MIVAYSRSDGAATNYEIAWVTVALQHLRSGTILGPDRSRAPMVVDPMVRRAQLGHVAAPTSLLALANCRQPQVTAPHATLCLSIEGRPGDRAAKPGDTTGPCLASCA